MKYCYACSVHQPFSTKRNCKFPHQQIKLKNLTIFCKCFGIRFIPNSLCYNCSVLSITPSTTGALAGILVWIAGYPCQILQKRNNHIKNNGQFSIGLFTLFIFRFCDLCVLDYFFHWQFPFSACFKCSTEIHHVQSRSTHYWLLNYFLMNKKTYRNSSKLLARKHIWKSKVLKYHAWCTRKSNLKFFAKMLTFLKKCINEA